MTDGSSGPLLTKASVISGLVGGLAHTGVAALIWQQGGVSLWAFVFEEPYNLAAMYLGLGVFSLGFVPALLYVGREVTSPAKVIVGFLLFSMVGSWLLGRPRPPATGLTMFGLYLFVWVIPVGFAVVAADIEYRQKRGNIV
jgi:hypothetical protein